MGDMTEEERQEIKKELFQEVGKYIDEREAKFRAEMEDGVDVVGEWKERKK
jgi:hypothetical protein